MSKVVRVGILGFGTVGTGVFGMLQDNADAIERKVGLPIQVVKIGIKDASKPRSQAQDLFTTDLESIINDPSIDVVIELIGGTDPAGQLVEQAIRNGKHVVTANKELIAKEGSRLVHFAKTQGLDLHYEAAVGGGIPIVQPLKHQLAGNDVIRMMGILNGTTNYILSQMEAEGAEFSEALAEAQAKGYAEADPTNDVEGFDTAYKISILASIAFGKQVPMEGVYREGISKVSKVDMEYAEIFGYKIKLLGIVDAVEKDQVLVRVHPAMLPKTHPDASVNDVYNALWLQGDFVGDLMFSGRGAGSHPTASAVVGDLIDVGRNIFVGGSGSAIPYDTGMKTAVIGDLKTSYYLRIRVHDKPRALGEIATVMGAYEISIAAMQMKTLPGQSGEIVFLTHLARESDIVSALENIARLPMVIEIASKIRVEDPNL